MPRNVPHLEFRGRLVLLGFGSIRQAVLPLLFRHLALRPERVTVIKAGQHNADKVRRHGMRLLVQPLTADKYQSLLTPLLEPGAGLRAPGPQHLLPAGFSAEGLALRAWPENWRPKPSPVRPSASTFARIRHRRFPGGALVLGMLYYRLKDLL